jgi:hypothetical protein
MNTPTPRTTEEIVEELKQKFIASIEEENKPRNMKGDGR